MKFLAATILICLVFSQTFSNWVMVMQYHLNRDYIANTLCENKTRPVLKCKGKCQLQKALVKSENQNNSNTIHPVKSKIPDVLQSQEWDHLNLASISREKPEYHGGAAPGDYTVPLPSIFHPPAV